jgi:FKBP-type peptidyl-prolyl cis-trans isomerase FkpA
MKKIILSALILLFFTHLKSQTADNTSREIPKPESAIKLQSLLDTISYIVGSDVAFTLKSRGMELNPESFSKGFTAAWNGNDSLFSIEEAETIMVKYGSEMQEKRKKEEEGKNALALAAGREFLEQNKNNEGVIVTSSGLQYQVLRQSEGEKPQADSKVIAHYKGTLIDGAIFDSSYERREPSAFDLSRLIPGWTEGLQLMSVGSKYIFFIPPHLGYGDHEIGAIPANSTLIFEVELLEIEK